MRAIIVDDELQSHRALRALLERDHPHIQLQATASCVQEGFDVILKIQPELVFLDIEMPDGTGFDLLKKLGRHDFNLIFITAFDQYALTAIKFGALDYLLKPIDPEELTRSIRKAEKKREEKIAAEQLQILWQTLQDLNGRKLPTRLAISTSEGIHYKMVRDIVRLEAHQNYTEFTLVDNKKKILASTNLGEYEQQFELYQDFMRVHRSHLVNLNFVDKYVKADGGYLVMKDGAQVSVSRLYRDELFKRLEGF